MKCKKCEGTGSVPNPAHYHAKAKYNTDYYLLIPNTIKCNLCKGVGYIIENLAEAISYLKQLEKSFSHSVSYKVDLLNVQQIIKLLEK